MGLGVLRFVSDPVVFIPTAEAGFVPTDSGSFRFSHTTADCSGLRYVYAEGELFRFGLVNNSTLYFAGNPVQTLTIASVEFFAQPGEPTLPLSQRGYCLANPGPGGTTIMLSVGPAKAVPVASFGLTPPFSIE